MKKWLKSVSCCAALIMALASGSSAAWASLIHHKIKVTNPTSYKVKVDLKMGGGAVHTREILAGQSYTFEVGNKCASVLYGKVYTDKVTYDMVIHCVGTAQEGSDAWCFWTCSSSDWKIVLESDGAYHFRKK